MGERLERTKGVSEKKGRWGDTMAFSKVNKNGLAMERGKKKRKTTWSQAVTRARKLQLRVLKNVHAKRKKNVPKGAGRPRSPGVKKSTRSGVWERN